MRQFSYGKKKHKGRKIFFLTLFCFLVIVGGMYGVRYVKHSYSPDRYGSYSWTKGETAFDLSLFDAENLYIDEDAETLRIMQIADPQLKIGLLSKDRKTYDCLDRALAAEKPDIAVVTGDLTLSVFTYDAYREFAEFMEERGQYWTVVYGNHDSQFDCSKYTLCQLLSGYDHCLFNPGPDNIKGESNFLINVYRGKDAAVPAYSLVMLDSGMYPEDGDVALTDWVYDWFGEDQIDWYRWAVSGLQALNPDIQTSVFYHIPTKETAEMYYADLFANGKEIPAAIDVSTLRECSDVEGVIRESDKNETELMDEGYLAGIFYQGKNTGLFDAMKELGSTKSVFYGHDHANNQRGYYDGIYLCYGRCSGYHTYPFFDHPNFLTKLFGLTERVLTNGELWVDEDGNQMEKGVTLIEIGVGDDNYGALSVLDREDSDFNK